MSVPTSVPTTIPAVISKGNTKIGNTPSVSLMPGATCRPNAPCARTCYMYKLIRMYPALHKSLVNNTALQSADLPSYFGDIESYLQRYSPKRFRFHVAGDFPSREYLTVCLALVQRHPETTFLAYTKQYEILASTLRMLRIFELKWPSNFKLFVSRWPGLAVPDEVLLAGFPNAWFHDASEPDPKMPATGVMHCPGLCPECDFWCWDQADSDVAFAKH